MKVLLMHRGKDFDTDAALPVTTKELVQDLELEILFESMGGDDRFLYDIAKKALLKGLSEPDSIRYRQAVLSDCIAAPFMARRLYAIALKAVEDKKRSWYSIHKTHPSAIMYTASRVIEIYLPLLRELKTLADENFDKCKSEGFSRFFSMIRKELDQNYTDTIRSHLRYMGFGKETLISAFLGKGLESREHRLRKAKSYGKSWVRRILSTPRPTFGFSISARDDAGCRALGEFRDRGMNYAADALAKSADHIENFFKLLLSEIAFYIGCLNLHDALAKFGEPLCMPTPLPMGSLGEVYTGLYNPCLTLYTGHRSVGSDANVVNKNPVIITGVNEGGKSTFLRSVGIAQLMMRSGMFAPAEDFSSDIATGIYTHYRRKEDRNMKSGKLDEELARMDSIAELLQPGSLMLFNESFAATNDREGSDIAGQITRALVDRGIRVYFVTHLYSFASDFAICREYKPLFLRTDRLSDGSRNFKIKEAPPTSRSYGEDLYRKVFGKTTGIPVASP